MTHQLLATVSPLISEARQSVDDLFQIGVRVKLRKWLVVRVRRAAHHVMASVTAMKTRKNAIATG